MKEIKFSMMAGWGCDHIMIKQLFDWCDKHCEGKVTRSADINADGFSFENESDVILFILTWK